MKLSQKFSDLKSRFFGGETREVARKEKFIEGILRTNAYSRLTLQDRILALGKLIMVFRSDCGFTPRSLERTMEKLTIQLNKETVQTWHQLYSK